MAAGPDIQSLFKTHFGFPPAHVVRAPATVELLGCSAEVPEALLISAALNRYVHVASAPRTDGRIELVSSVFAQPERFWVTDLKRNPAAAWADLPKAILDQLDRRGVHFSGFSALFHDEIPAGGGLGRFAAVEVATALTVRRLFPFRLSSTGLSAAPQRDSRGSLPPMSTVEKTMLAGLCLSAEKQFLKLDSTCSAHLTCLLAKAWHLMSLTVAPSPPNPGTVDYLPLIGEAVVFCIPPIRVSSQANSHALAALCERAVKKLGVRTLRQLTSRELARRKSCLIPVEYNCAAHVIAELARVVAAERALRAEDHAQFGSYLVQSHQSAHCLAGGCGEELNFLVNCSLGQKGCAGARAHGNAVVAIVAHHQVQAFAEHVSSEFRRHAASELQTLVCQTADGAE